MRLTTTALLLLCVGCVGCTRVVDGGAKEGSLIEYKTYGTHARQYTFDDGTRCVVVVDTGVSCDWQHSRNEVE